MPENDGIQTADTSTVQIVQHEKSKWWLDWAEFSTKFQYEEQLCTNTGLFKPENRKELLNKQNELYQQQNKLL